jgi:hypothetical protein
MNTLRLVLEALKIPDVSSRWVIGMIAMGVLGYAAVQPYLKSADHRLCEQQTRVMTVAQRDGEPVQVVQHAAWYRAKINGGWYQVCRLDGQELLKDRGYPRKV